MPIRAARMPSPLRSPRRNRSSTCRASAFSSRPERGSRDARAYSSGELPMTMAALRLTALASFALSAFVASAHAQDYPAREIYSVVNFGPGSGMDIMIRYYSAKLSELAGKPVVVVNKAGVQGNIATEYLVRAKPDGYTIMITPASAKLAAAASLFKKLPFD